MSFLLCTFKMLTCCGCRNKVINKYAFYPPQASYQFQLMSSSNRTHSQSLTQIIDPPPNSLQQQQQSSNQHCPEEKKDSSLHSDSSSINILQAPHDKNNTLNKNKDQQDSNNNCDSFKIIKNEDTDNINNSSNENSPENVTKTGKNFASTGAQPQQRNLPILLKNPHQQQQQQQQQMQSKQKSNNVSAMNEKQSAIDAEPQKMKQPQQQQIPPKMRKTCSLPTYKFLLSVDGNLKELPPLSDLNLVCYKLQMPSEADSQSQSPTFQQFNNGHSNDSKKSLHKNSSQSNSSSDPKPNPNQQENQASSSSSSSSADTSTIACIYIEYTKTPTDYVVLFSHGNSTDLGYMLDSYLDLAFNCRVNVVAYDYSGYGLSTGQLSDRAILRNIETVYRFLTQGLHYDWSKIILYGQSVGSGPSTYLASNHLYPVGGLVIHSGFMSGLRIMLGQNITQTDFADIFPNIDEMQYVNCPVFIIHGVEDTAISIEHAQQLHLRVKKPFKPLYIAGAGHNNIENDNAYRQEYYIRLREFLKHVKAVQASKNEEELLLYCRADQWDHSFKHLYKAMIPIMEPNNGQMSRIKSLGKNNNNGNNAMKQQQSLQNTSNLNFFYQQQQGQRSQAYSINNNNNQSSLEADLLDKRDQQTICSKSLTEMHYLNSIDTEKGKESLDESFAKQQQASSLQVNYISQQKQQEQLQQPILQQQQ